MNAAPASLIGQDCSLVALFWAEMMPSRAHRGVDEGKYGFDDTDRLLCKTRGRLANAAWQSLVYPDAQQHDMHDTAAEERQRAPTLSLCTLPEVRAWDRGMLIADERLSAMVGS